MVPGLYLYDQAFQYFNFGYACAIGVILFVIILAFTILNMRTYFATLPQELIDAARVDGASEFVVVSRVVVPLSVPILATVGILNLLATWNDYIWPLVTLRDTSLYTIPSGIAYLAASANGVVSYTEQMAAYVIVSLPLVILFFFMMRLFVQGLSSGAIKV